MTPDLGCQDCDFACRIAQSCVWFLLLLLFHTWVQAGYPPNNVVKVAIHLWNNVIVCAVHPPVCQIVAWIIHKWDCDLPYAIMRSLISSKLEAGPKHMFRKPWKLFIPVLFHIHFLCDLPWQASSLSVGMLDLHPALLLLPRPWTTADWAFVCKLCFANYCVKCDFATAPQASLICFSLFWF